MPDKRLGLGVWAAPWGCSCGGLAVWAPAPAAAQGVISGILFLCRCWDAEFGRGMGAADHVLLSPKRYLGLSVASF